MVRANNGRVRDVLFKLQISMRVTDGQPRPANGIWYLVSILLAALTTPLVIQCENIETKWQQKNYSREL